MIIFGGVLATASGVALISLGSPWGWPLVTVGLVAILGGMYEKMR
jgi:hypothetical protein